MLARVGWRVEADGQGLKTNVIDNAGVRHRLFAGECWALLKERGLIVAEESAS